MLLQKKSGSVRVSRGHQSRKVLKRSHFQHDPYLTQTSKIFLYVKNYASNQILLMKNLRENYQLFSEKTQTETCFKKLALPN